VTSPLFPALASDVLNGLISNTLLGVDATSDLLYRSVKRYFGGFVLQKVVHQLRFKSGRAFEPNKTLIKS